MESRKLRDTRFPVPEEEEIYDTFKGDKVPKLPPPRPKRGLPPISEEIEPLPEASSGVSYAASPVHPKIDASSASSKLPPVHDETPWNTYTPLPLKSLNRGGQIIVAYKSDKPGVMVAVQNPAANFKERTVTRHRNLLTIKELYQYDGQIFVITDYTATSLKNLIAIPMPFKESHVSATCRQESSSSNQYPALLLTDCRYGTECCTCLSVDSLTET